MIDEKGLRTSSEATAGPTAMTPQAAHIAAPTKVIGAPAKRLLTIADFSLAYGICRSRVYEELNSGRLVGLKAGRATLVPVEAAEQWAANLPRYMSGTIGQ